MNSKARPRSSKFFSSRSATFFSITSIDDCNSNTAVFTGRSPFIMPNIKHAIVFQPPLDVTLILFYLKIMNMKHAAKSIRAFIGAKNFGESRQFYKELGFEESPI